MDCLLLGDSIALGLAAALKASGMACAVAARVGAHSADIGPQLASTGARQVIVLSTGTNDPPRTNLAPQFAAIRAALGRARVVWILPYRRNAAYAATQVAFRFGDGVVDLARLPTRDNVHPTSYRALADLVRR